MISILAVASLLIALATSATAIAGGYEAIEIVPPRHDVTVRILDIQANSKPSTLLILFPGAEGPHNFAEHDRSH